MINISHLNLHSFRVVYQSDNDICLKIFYFVLRFITFPMLSQFFGKNVEKRMETYVVPYLWNARSLKTRIKKTKQRRPG